MGKVIKLDDYRDNWTLVFNIDGARSSIAVYSNDRTGEVEFVQVNDDGEAITTKLSTVESVGIAEAIRSAHKRIVEK